MATIHAARPPCCLPPVRDAATKETGAPSAGSTLDLATERVLSCFPVKVHAEEPSAPFRPSRMARPVRTRRRVALPPPLLCPPRGRPRWNVEDASRQLLQPTFDTSTRVIARLPSAQASHQVSAASTPPTPRLRQKPARTIRVAPDRLAATRPRLTRALTARCQLRSFSCTLTVARGFLLSEENRVGARRAHDGAPLSGAAPLHERPLTSPCHAHSRTTVGAIIRPRTSRTASTAASSKATACDDPRRLPSAGAPWTRPPPERRPSPSQILVGSLPPCPSLCREGAGFRGPFVDLCSREG